MGAVLVWFAVAVLWIRTGFSADPDLALWVNADPDPALDPGRINGFLMTNNNKNFTMNCYLFLSKSLQRTSKL
jgi:hypothetical protein